MIVAMIVSEGGKIKMKINPNEVRKHISNPLHVQNFLQGKKLTRNKKKYTRKQKYRQRYY